MKKSLSILLALLLVFSFALTGCKPAETPTAAPENMEVIPTPAPKNGRSILNSSPESTMEVIPTPAPRQVTSTGITQTSYIDPTNVAVGPVPGERSEKTFLKLKK